MAAVSSGSPKMDLSGAQAVEAGHADIHQYDIGAASTDYVDCGPTIARLSDYPQVGFGIDDDPESGSQQRLIVCDDDSDRSTVGRLLPDCAGCEDGDGPP